MITKISNKNYQSLGRDTIESFSVEFEFSRKSFDEIFIESFSIINDGGQDVSTLLSVGDYDRLMVELQDFVGCNSSWTKDDQQEVDWSSHPDY